MQNAIKVFSVVLLAALVTPIWVIGQSDGTLAQAQQRGSLRCGVHGSLPGFGFLNTSSGEFSGFDVDYCKAIAAAIGVPRVEYIALTASERFTALQSGQIDVLIRNTTWTLTRDSQEVAANFAPTTFYDGQGFIVRISDNINSLADLDGATICVTAGTTTEGNVADAFRERGLTYTQKVFTATADAFGTFESGGCDAYTSDKSQLASLASTSPNKANLKILPETISKEPLGPLTRHGDDKWFDVVKWVVYATFFGEEYGITQANVAAFESTNPEILRFLGQESSLGPKLGLAEDWTKKVIAAVGNYAEIYERHLGAGGLNIPRDGTLNASYKNGGLLYAPAWR